MAQTWGDDSDRERSNWPAWGFWVGGAALVVVFTGVVGALVLTGAFSGGSSNTVPASVVSVPGSSAPSTGAPVTTLVDGVDLPDQGSDRDEALASPGQIAVAPPQWLGQRVLPVGVDGLVPPQTTPPELQDRQFFSPDHLPPPDGDQFVGTVAALEGEPLARSTWHEGCPVSVDELRYITVTFHGFDGLSHTGELIAHRDVAADLVDVFRELYQVQFPIEEMRIVTAADMEADPTGDGNNTASFVCRAVTGGLRFSEHAYGLAIDVNPFHNPYVRGEVVLPELAASYLDRTPRAGVIVEGDVVVEAFETIGWGWGGRWQSLKDYQHFALRDR